MVINVLLISFDDLKILNSFSISKDLGEGRIPGESLLYMGFCDVDFQGNNI